MINITNVKRAWKGACNSTLPIANTVSVLLIGISAICLAGYYGYVMIMKIMKIMKYLASTAPETPVEEILSSLIILSMVAVTVISGLFVANFIINLAKEIVRGND